MTDDNDPDTGEPIVPDEPQPHPDEVLESGAVWRRGLVMLVLALLFALGETVLAAAAILQFGWMLFGKTRNRVIADFGQGLAGWMAAVTRFQTGASDDKPFPWSRWG